MKTQYIETQLQETNIQQHMLALRVHPAETRLTVYRRMHIMVAWESGMPLGPKLSMASRAFKRDMLGIHLSDFHKNSKETSLGIKKDPV